ncbi:MAG TPA: helix-turn-helix transcriptional regulator [Solirubrobacteraceae bacterium]|jgi:transcriptional regulator with XRE-family HTH domain|nr:helix-turn-helix transcriptional regulator [Solirubrobacteraceae bacterium]
MPSPTSTADPALSAAVRRLRTERGLTIEALATSAGVSINTISQLERAKAEPGWMTVRRVAEALGISLAELGEAVEREGRAKP